MLRKETMPGWWVWSVWVSVCPTPRAAPHLTWSFDRSLTLLGAPHASTSLGIGQVLFMTDYSCSLSNAKPIGPSHSMPQLTSCADQSAVLGTAVPGDQRVPVSVLTAHAW